MSDVRILDFDIENRPLAYLGPDFTTAEITAIAACWVGESGSMTWWLLGEDSPKAMLEGFRRLYNKADMVTGHYIRKHDLPIINGSMLELGLESLEEKLTSDTKLDLVKNGHVISASQENLSATLGVDAPKIHMNNAMWRESNRLTTRGLAYTRQRVVGDVVQHMAMRKILLERDLLHDPKVWRA